MDSKTCSKCGEVKALDEFHNRSGAKDGKRASCKVCRGNYMRQYHQDNRDYRLAYLREWQDNNKETLQEYKREYHKKNRDQICANKRKYYQDNRTKIVRAVVRNSVRRYRSDPMFALKEQCRGRIRKALRGHGFSKSASTKDMLGCTYEELMQHLESQFVDGMSWDSRSEWHIDHIIPLSAAKTEEEMLTLCHYTNLQPLWAEDNLRKSATVPQDNNCTELLT